MEENKRHDIFLENNKIIAQHNAQPYHSHLMKINQFSDLTPQEFKDKMLMKSLPNMTEIKRVFKSKKLAGLPKKWDWRLEGAVTPVKEQGSCGSCWTFSTAGTLEGFQYLKTGHLVPLSEQNLLDCNLEDEWGCDGGWPATALEFVKENGIVTEETYPYNGKVQTCR